MYGESGFPFILRQWRAHVGAGSQDRNGVDRREKKRDGGGIDTTYGLMAEDMASLDTILVRNAFSRSSELQCT
jgi:hypothetical protein